MITGAAQRNRNHLANHLDFGSNVEFAMEELLLDPQTSGGLLVSVPRAVEEELVAELSKLDLPAAIVGEIVERKAKEIMVR